jgi:ActR/RegA family two-component response regulator
LVELILVRCRRPALHDDHLAGYVDLEVLRPLRADLATRRTPVVMISVDPAAAVANGHFGEAQAFLAKPPDVTSVISAIDRAMQPVAAA